MSISITSGTYTIDPSHSEVGFVARHAMVTKVRGWFRDVTGTITVADDFAASSATATMKVDSVDTGNADRDGHLKSADFFDAENHPVATIVSTAVRPKGDAYLLDGNLTIKGNTRPVTLNLEFNGVSPGMGNGEVSGYEASVVINRKDFGVDLDLPMETGGAVVGDKVTITLDIEAVKQA